MDGYVPGAPNRKVSIYTEGCLLSFVFDVFIIKNSDGKYSLDDVMKHLYEDFYQKNKGVSEQDYRNAIASFAGTSVTTIFENYVHNVTDYTQLLQTSFDIIGLKMVAKPNDKISQSKVGVKTLSQGSYFVVKSIYPNSPADISGLMLEDEIIAVQAMDVNGNLDAWLGYFNQEEIVVMVKRKGVFLNKTITLDSKGYYPEYFLQESNEKSEEQKKYFERWSK